MIYFQASHVLIDRIGRAKISGFRYSCSLIETTTDETCLPAVGCALQDRYDYPLYVANKHLNWMSPEILQQVSIIMHKNFEKKVPLVQDKKLVK